MANPANRSTPPGAQPAGTGGERPDSAAEEGSLRMLWVSATNPWSPCRN